MLQELFAKFAQFVDMFRLTSQFLEVLELFFCVHNLDFLEKGSHNFLLFFFFFCIKLRGQPKESVPRE